MSGAPPRAATTAAALFSVRHMALPADERAVLKSFVVEEGVGELLDPAAAGRFLRARTAEGADPGVTRARLLRLLERLQVGLTAHLERFWVPSDQPSDPEEDPVEPVEEEPIPIPEHPRSRDRRMLEASAGDMQAFQELVTFRLAGALRGRSIAERVTACRDELAGVIAAMKAGETGGLRLSADGQQVLRGEAEVLRTAELDEVRVGADAVVARLRPSGEEGRGAVVPVLGPGAPADAVRVWGLGLVALRSALSSGARVSQAQQLVWQGMRVRVVELCAELGLRAAVEAVGGQLAELRRRGVTEYEPWLVVC